MKSVLIVLLSGPEPERIINFLNLIGCTSTGYTALPTILSKIVEKDAAKNTRPLAFIVEIILFHIERTFKADYPS